MKEIIVGAIDFGFNASAALVSNTRGVFAAISQERLNLVKNTKEFPIDALIACCKQNNINKIDYLAVSHYEPISVKYLYKFHDGKQNLSEQWMMFLNNVLNELCITCIDNLTDEQTEKVYIKFIEQCLNYHQIRLATDFYTRVEHHRAHEYSCYPVYGRYKNRIVLTSDGFGDGFSGRITRYTDNKEELLSEVPLIASPALIYQFVTGAMGYKEHQHEGKVTGLAAHGKNAKTDELIYYLTGSKDLTTVGNGFNINKDILLFSSEAEKKLIAESGIQDFDVFLRLKKTIYNWCENQLGTGYSKDDILDIILGNKAPPKNSKILPQDLAFTVQDLAERVTLNWIKNVIPLDCKGYDIYLAGGLFANVKLNQRIKDLNFFKNVYVSPAMGDEGTALGAAWFVMENLTEKVDFSNTETGFVWGDEAVISGAHQYNYDGSMRYVEREAEKATAAGKIKIIKYISFEETADAVADMLAQNEIVHWRVGRGEFGPRALGHATTYYTAKDENGTKVLNKAMHRTETMPFAPIILEKHLDEFFNNYESVKDSLKYMTMTLDVKPEFAEQYKGATHVDNTARPQVIYDSQGSVVLPAKLLLEKYEAKTGNKVLINTSYNVHNTPTCNLASNCWDSWVASDFVGRALVIDTTIFKKVN
jgi:carbamoyltransferase